jgi:hypothetical protein
MDQVAGFEFRFAEDLGVRLADQQAGQGEDIGVSARVDACGQLLGLRFQFGAQRLVQRHVGAPRRGRLRIGPPIFARPGQKFYQLFSCSHL